MKIPGSKEGFNQELIKALRTEDAFEVAKLLCMDALNREESCGAHFREEYQTEEGEALRDDENFAFASLWKFNGEGQAPELLKEMLEYEFVKRQQRNYKA